MNFNTPILVILFNRSNNAQQLFNSIKKLKPNKIYINIDGPRINNQNDLIEVQKCKEIFYNKEKQHKHYMNYFNVMKQKYNSHMGVIPLQDYEKRKINVNNIEFVD